MILLSGLWRQMVQARLSVNFTEYLFETFNMPSAGRSLRSTFIVP